MFLEHGTTARLPPHPDGVRWQPGAGRAGVVCHARLGQSTRKNAGIGQRRLTSPRDSIHIATSADCCLDAESCRASRGRMSPPESADNAFAHATLRVQVLVAAGEATSPGYRESGSGRWRLNTIGPMLVSGLRENCVQTSSRCRMGTRCT